MMNDQEKIEKLTTALKDIIHILPVSIVLDAACKTADKDVILDCLYEIEEIATTALKGI